MNDLTEIARPSRTKTANKRRRATYRRYVERVTSPNVLSFEKRGNAKRSA